MSLPLLLKLVHEGRVFETAFQEALAQGRITPELASAFDDSAVRRSRTCELAVAAAITTVMVLKPF
ncbi:MAG TPA: hypothetical protein VMS73_10325 [Anaerolineaceae bacterium]|nr:hypothetical protein [Anaerolineaceae bacterium]